LGNRKKLFYLFVIFLLAQGSFMSYEERIEASETRITKAVFPNTTNHYATLFGGTALQWMDEAAFITATRFCRQKMVTVCSDRIDFKHPIPAGTFVELVGRVVKVGNTSLQVQVTVYLEQMYDESRTKAIEGLFTFVAIDENMQPVPVRKE
jgi:acyl-CoA hydrolase